MTTREFIEAFNKSEQREKAQLIVNNGLEDPSQHLIFPMPPNAPFDSIHILGYAKMRVGLWYVTMRSGKKTVMHAFRLHSSGKATYKEFVKYAQQNVFTTSIREKFVESFEHLVAPLHADN